jgi:hypothetical protein
MRLAPLAALLLTGCATFAPPQDRPSLEEALPTVSNLQVCQAVILAPADVAEMAQDEAIRRGLDCRDYVSGVVQQKSMEQQRQDAFDAERRAVLRRSITPSPRVNCRSTTYGGVTQTLCD